MVKVKGACHCGSVRFEAEIDTQCTAHECNCSICRMCGFQHVIVPKSRFHLLAGQHSLSEYRFGSRIARHLFCSTCGVKAFYVPRSNPDGFSLNLRCLALPDGVEIGVEPFDGQNWEKNAAALSRLSCD